MLHTNAHTHTLRTTEKNRTEPIGSKSKLAVVATDTLMLLSLHFGFIFVMLILWFVCHFNLNKAHPFGALAK